MRPILRAFAPALLVTLLGSVAAEAESGDGRHVIAPPYAPSPELVPADGVPQGTLHEFVMSSAESAIFPADIATGEPFERPVSVYVPAQYRPGTDAPFLVVQDGVSYFQGTMTPMLDAMIAAGTLPAMVVIFVEPGPDGGPGIGQRSLEYDSLTDDYLTFVETELRPRVEQEAAVSLTDDPAGRATMGGSSGGTAAFTMGWFAPDKYRLILTYSGSFVSLQPSAEYPGGAWDYQARLIPKSPAKPLRVALSASEYDFDMNDDSERRRNWIAANEAMADALAAKGYAYRYLFAKEADHVDYRVVEQTLPETLRWLWQGYPIAE